MCRTAARRPVACCKIAATWLKVRSPGVLGAEQLDGVAGGCPHYRDQDERGASAGSGVDQVGVAGPVHRCRRDATGPGEAMHRGDDCADAAERPGDAGGIADIPAGHLYPGTGQVLRPGWVPGQHPHRQALAGQPRDQPGAERAGAPGDDDHRREPAAGPAPARTCRRTASSTPGPPACTGSR
jgi:hypothetical protein